MTFLLIILIYFLFLSKKSLIWLVLPLGILTDLFLVKQIGMTGIKIMAGVFLLSLFFPQKTVKDKYKLI